jgi:hypothetical protein
VNEQGWDTCTDPALMLEFLRTSGKASKRKMLLFACACCRLAWSWLIALPVARDAVDVAEQDADGMARWWKRWKAVYNITDTPKLIRRSRAASVLTAALLTVRRWGGNPTEEAEAVATLVACACETGFNAASEREGKLLRDLFGNPFRPVSLHPAWLTPTVVTLAHVAYNERDLPSGHLDPARLGVLADALEEAGRTNVEVLGHLRGPGPHVRGCFVLDAILGKE